MYWLLRLQKTILSKMVFLSIITPKLRSMRIMICSDSEYQRLLLSLFRFGTSAVTLFLFVQIQSISGYFFLCSDSENQLFFVHIQCISRYFFLCSDSENQLFFVHIQSISRYFFLCSDSEHQRLLLSLFSLVASAVSSFFVQIRSISGFFFLCSDSEHQQLLLFLFFFFLF